MTLEQRVAVLEAEVARLKQALADDLGGCVCPACGYKQDLPSALTSSVGNYGHIYDSVQVQK